MIDIAYTHPSLARLDFTDLWGAEELCWLSQYDGLEYFRLNPLGAYCLEIADDYEPDIPAHLTPLTVFPDLRVCSESPPSADERLTLETFANIESEGVWRLARGKTLSAVENGHNLTSLRDFLTARDPGQLLPETVEGFLRSIERNARAMKTLGGAILIECSDQEVAAKLVSDKRVSKLCLPAGKNHLVVRTASEKAFSQSCTRPGVRNCAVLSCSICQTVALFCANDARFKFASRRIWSNWCLAFLSCYLNFSFGRF